MDETHSERKVFDIRQRSFTFAVRVVKLCRALQQNPEVARPVNNQLIDAGTSVGANLEEAKAGQSRRDFIHKNAIALKEIRETRYWLRLIEATATLESATRQEIRELIVEAEEIARIVGKIIVNTEANTL